MKSRDELTKLFETIPEIDILTNRSDTTPQFDFHLPIMSMPYILDFKSFDDIPKQMPYLHAKDDKDLKIKKSKNQIDIGICWSASVTGESYEGKVFDLKYLLPLIKHPKINLYSLQVGPENEDIKKYGFQNDIIDLTHKLTDFSKTASLVKQLDLVISSDTSVAQLCGALNASVWIPLQKYPDWRWQNKGNKTNWYPSATLFRQKSLGDWNSVLLRSRVHSHSSGTGNVSERRTTHSPGKIGTAGSAEPSNSPSPSSSIPDNSISRKTTAVSLSLRIAIIVIS